jgi:hypothetical protein
LLSALVDSKNSKREQKEDQVRRYASLLPEAEFEGEKNLSSLTEDALKHLGIPYFHAVAISAVGNLGKKG